MKRREIIAYGLGAMSLAAGARSTARAASDTPIRIGYRPTVAIDLAFVRAVSLNEFKAAGFNVELVPFARSDQIAEALTKGTLEGSTGVPLEPYVTMAAKNAYPARAHVVWYFDPKVPYDAFLVLANSSIHSLDDLKSARISSYPSAQVSYLLSKMLPNAAIKPYDTANALGPLASGEADATFTIEPTISQNVASGQYRMIEPSSIARVVFNGERVPAAVSLVSSKWIAEKPQQANDFLRLTRKIHAENRKSDSPDWKVSLLADARFGGFSAAVAARVVEPASSDAADVTPHQFQLFQQLLQDIKVLDQPVDFTKIAYTP